MQGNLYSRAPFYEEPEVPMACGSCTSQTTQQATNQWWQCHQSNQMSVLRHHTALWIKYNFFIQQPIFSQVPSLQQNCPSICPNQWQQPKATLTKSERTLDEEELAARTKTMTDSPFFLQCHWSQTENDPNVNVYAAMVEASTESIRVYTDQTGWFPITSWWGNKYLMILYDYEINAILAEPFEMPHLCCHDWSLGKATWLFGCTKP